MKKSTERTLFILSVAFAAIIATAAVLSTGRQFNVFSIGTGCEGISVVGVPQVTPVINPATGQTKNKLKISFLPDCGGASISGTFGSAFLKGFTGYSFNNDFTLRAAAKPETLIYQPMNDRVTAFEGYYAPPTTLGCQPQPPPGPNWTLHTTANYNCGFASPVIWSRVAGVKGHLAPIPSVRFNTTVTFDVGSVSVSRVVSSGQGFATWVSDNATVATCEWKGDLVTGDAPPDATGVVTLYNPAANKWNLATLAEWGAYTSAETRFNAVPGSVDVYGGQYLDSGAAGALTAAKDALFASTATLPVPGQFTSDGSGYAVTTAPQIQRPQLDCLIDGDFLGIVKPEGIPSLKFTGTDPAAYHAGNAGFLLFTAGNTGNFSAGFDLAVACAGTPVINPQQITIAAHGTQSVRVPFAVDLPGNYNCQATLTDLTEGSTSAAAKALFALAVQVCQPGQVTSLNDTALRRCRADGSGYDVALDCSKPVTTALTVGACISPYLATLAASQTGGYINPATGLAGTPPPPSGTPANGTTVTASAGATNLAQTNCAYGYNDKDGVFHEANNGYSITTRLTTTYWPTLSYDSAAGQWACGSANDPNAKVVSASTATPAPNAQPPPAPVKAPKPSAAPGAPKPSPGFEAVFAVAGLLAVAYLVNRRKR